MTLVGSVPKAVKDSIAVLFEVRLAGGVEPMKTHAAGKLKAQLVVFPIIFTATDLATA